MADREETVTITIHDDLLRGGKHVSAFVHQEVMDQFYKPAIANVVMTKVTDIIVKEVSEEVMKQVKDNLVNALVSRMLKVAEVI